MVSVIVPVYNTRKDYLEKCIQSIVCQTYKNIEIIIVDDGSTKETAQLCDEFLRDDLRIEVLHKENGGVSSARNRAMKIAKGEYIAFVDSDDWIENDFIEKMRSKMDFETDLVISNIIYENGAKDSYDDYDCRIEEFDKDVTFCKMLYSAEIGGFLCNKLFRKKLIKQPLDENIHYSEDFLFTAEYCENIKKACFINVGLYHYRQDNDSATYNLTYNKKILTLLDAYRKIEIIYRKNAPKEVVFIQRNILKIALNLRARYKIDHINAVEEYNKIVQIIYEYMSVVLLEKKIKLFTKINIIFTWLMPKTLFKIKSKLLGRKI